MGDHEHCLLQRHRGAIVEEGISAILSSVDLKVVLNRTGDLLRRYFGTAGASIVRYIDAAPGFIEMLHVDDSHGPVPEVGAQFPLAGSMCEVVLTSRRPFVLDHLDPTSPRLLEERIFGAAGYGAVASFPLIFESQVLGALNIAHTLKEGFLESCLESAEQVARLLAIALHNSLMVEEVKRLNLLLGQENTLLREQIQKRRKDARYIAEGALMREVMARVMLVAPTESTVLIRGETGTGKEGLAHMLHELSPRVGGPFITVNLGALQDTLIESELFGYEKGAFTGASQRTRGRFEQAEGGTIFLDEVGDAPMPVQVRLLRALQEREIQRVGGGETFKVNVRVLAATSRPLEEMAASGTFRSDLYFRLSTFPVILPPLRERRDEIRPLASYFLARCAEAMDRQPPRAGEAAWQRLESYDWPGNVRELQNFIERSLILCPGPELILGEQPGAWGQAVATPNLRPSAVPRFEDAMQGLLAAALGATGGRIYGPSGAAALLGMKPTTLQGKLRKYGVKTGRGRAGQ